MSNFVNTLNVIEENLKSDSRLSHLHRIWCQGCNKNSVTLVITLFTASGSYTQKFIDFKNFINYKGDLENPAFKNQLESIVAKLV